MNVQIHDCDDGRPEAAQWRAALALAVLMLAELAEQVSPAIIDSATIQAVARDILDGTERGRLFVQNHAQAMKSITIETLEEAKP